MQIRCNFPDISYLSETQKNNFWFLNNFKIYMRFDDFQILMMLLEAGAQPDSKDAENRYRYKKRIFLSLSILRTNKNLQQPAF